MRKKYLFSPLHLILILTLLLAGPVAASGDTAGRVIDFLTRKLLTDEIKGYLKLRKDTSRFPGIDGK